MEVINQFVKKLSIHVHTAGTAVKQYKLTSKYCSEDLKLDGWLQRVRRRNHSERPSVVCTGVAS